MSLLSDLKYMMLEIINPLTDPEIIQSIKEEYIKIGSTQYVGALIATNKRYIYFAIDNEKGCCEYFGFLGWDAEDANDLIGDSLRHLKFSYKEELDNHDDFKQTWFIDIQCSGLSLTLTAYNAHNGYYGHEVKCFQIHLDHNLKEPIDVNEVVVLYDDAADQNYYKQLRRTGN